MAELEAMDEDSLLKWAEKELGIYLSTNSSKGQMLGYLFKRGLALSDGT